MRVPRSIQLFEDSGYVHKFWRCHNRSYLLEQPRVKDLYLSCTRKGLEHQSVSGKVKLSAFCIMNNHSHMLMDYEASSVFLSRFMRVSHSSFGYEYNRANMRSGKVANERPKTPLIEDPNHCMRVHFYIEANPIRAGFRKIENLHLYQYSSYGFFAYGIKTKWTSMITVPQWYLDLGKNWKTRQKVYRKLFREYLSLNSTIQDLFCSYIGSILWVRQKKVHEKKWVEKRSQSPP